MTRPLPEQRALGMRRLMTVGEAADTLRCGRTLVYEMLRTGRIRRVKLGRLTRIHPDSLEQLMAALSVGGEASVGDTEHQREEEMP